MYTLWSLTLIASCWGRDCYYNFFVTDGETEAQWIRRRAHSRWQSQDLNPCSLAFIDSLLIIILFILPF